MNGIDPSELLGGFGFTGWAHMPVGSVRFSVCAAGSFEAVERLVGRRLDPLGTATVRKRVLSAHAAPNGGTTYLWTGPFFEFSVFTHGPYRGLDAVVDTLAQFDVDETPMGLVLSSRPGFGCRIDDVVAANSTHSGLGLTVYPALTADAEAAVRARPPLSVERYTASGGNCAVLASRRCLTAIGFDAATELAAHDLAHRAAFEWSI